LIFADLLTLIEKVFSFNTTNIAPKVLILQYVTEFFYYSYLIAFDGSTDDAKCDGTINISQATNATPILSKTKYSTDISTGTALR
jgi:hypothetical protein